MTATLRVTKGSRAVAWCELNAYIGPKIFCRVSMDAPLRGRSERTQRARCGHAAVRQAV